MARRFVASSGNHVSLSLGALNFAFGPGTIAVIVRTASVDTQDQDMLSAGTGLDWAFWMWGAGNNLLSFWVGAAASSSDSGTLTIVPNDGWVFAAVSKATGSAAPRFYKYQYSTGLWGITNGGVIVNSAVPDGSAEIATDIGGGSYFNGDWAMGAVWNVQLTDPQVCSLALAPTLSNWSASVKPRAIWIPDLGVNVSDLSGNGANETSHVGAAQTPDEFPPFNQTTKRTKLGYGRRPFAPINYFYNPRTTMATDTVSGIKTWVGANYAGGQVKTVLGVPKAQIKTIEGLA